MENVVPLLNQIDIVVREDTEKAELLNVFFASVFTAEVSPQDTQILEVREGGWRKEDLPVVLGGWVEHQLSRFTTHKSRARDRTHPQVLRELAGVVKPLSITFEKSWVTGDVPNDWRKVGPFNRALIG